MNTVYVIFLNIYVTPVKIMPGAWKINALWFPLIVMAKLKTGPVQTTCNLSHVILVPGGLVCTGLVLLFGGAAEPRDRPPDPRSHPVKPLCLAALSGGSVLLHDTDSARFKHPDY